MNTYTKEETRAISQAWDALSDLCRRTNWDDLPALQSAYRAERAAAYDSDPEPILWARAQVLSAWLKGAADPEQPLSSVYWVRAGFLAAMLLGVRHQIERAGTEYNGALVAELHKLAKAAADAQEARTLRTYTSTTAAA
jgi:hypothetical protein